MLTSCNSYSGKVVKVGSGILNLYKISQGSVTKLATSVRCDGKNYDVSEYNSEIMFENRPAFGNNE